MKCPLCGAQIKEGSLYCDVCGEDIHIVPDFDPEVEDTCRDTIKSMTEGIFDKPAPDSDLPISPKENRNNEHTKQKDIAEDEPPVINNKKNVAKGPLLFILIAFVVIILAAVFIYYAIYFKSDSYILSEAGKAYSAGNYEKAGTYYEKLLENDRYNSELLDKYSICLYAVGDMDGYEDCLLRIIDNFDSTDEQRLSAYAKVIALYDSRKEYTKIADLILASGDDTIINGYSGYLVSEPSFSLSEEEYDLPQLLNITADSGDEIYYSLTGDYNGNQTQLASDILYSGAILLDKGTYTVSAYAKSSRGVCSDTVTGKITISVKAPAMPAVHPGNINSNVPVYVYLDDYDSDSITVYYTTDGSAPNEKSSIYTGRILLMNGTYNFNFICYDKNTGLYSETVNENIVVEAEYNYTADDGIPILMQYLFEKQITDDEYGKIDESGNRITFEFEDIFATETDFCYIYKELLLSSNGNYKDVDVRYSMNAVTGEVSRIND